MLYFFKKTLTWAKLRKPWYWKVLLLKLNMGVYLRIKFQVSNIILTNFRQLVILPPLLPTSKWTPTKPTHIRLSVFACLHASRILRLLNRSNEVIKKFIIFSSSIVVDMFHYWKSWKICVYPFSQKPTFSHKSR